MNLPSYTLGDVPVSNVLNVCLAALPHGAPAPSGPKRRHGPDTQPDKKGKGRAYDQHAETVEDDYGWEDAEFRAARTFAPARGKGERGEGDAQQWRRSTREGGWDEYFGAATSEGWTLYATYPLRMVKQHAVRGSSLRIVLPLHRSNIIFLVGGPPAAMYPPNEVIIYDTELQAAVVALTFPSDVLGLTARKDRLLVVLERSVELFVLGHGPDGVWQEGAWETCYNKRGLAALATDIDSTLLVFPGRQPGQVAIVHLPPFDPSRPPPTRLASDAHDPRSSPYPTSAVIVAHESPLAALSVTPSGSLIATASETGTLVRVWDPRSSALLRELRRGTDGAEIWSIRIRPDGEAVAVSSDKGTVHVWDLSSARELERERRREEESAKPVSLSILKPYLPKYFHSQWSDAYFRLPAPAALPPKNLPLPRLFGEPSPMETPKPPTIEDDICLVTWILGDTPVMQSSADTPSTPPYKGKSTHSARPGSLRFAPTPPPSNPATEPQIVAITRSGGWYRLHVPDAASRQAHGGSPPPTPVSGIRGADQARSRRRTSSQVGGEKSTEMVCVEYRRFGETEVWSEDEEDEVDAETGHDADDPLNDSFFTKDR